MAYSKAKFKSNYDKTPPLFWTIGIGKIPDGFAYPDFTVGFIS